MQVEISLSPGLSFAGTQPQAPSSGTFDTSTGIWKVGTMEARRTGHPSLPVAVNLSSDSLTDLPLEERCLTAKVVRAVPWLASDPLKRVNDTATACLGDPPVLIEQWRGMRACSTFYRLRRRHMPTPPAPHGDTLEMFVW